MVAEKFEDENIDNKHNQDPERLNNGSEPEKLKENSLVEKSAEVAVRNFDLNVDLNENYDSSAPTMKPAPEMKHEEYPGWSISDMEKMAIDPIQLATLNQRIDDEEEDYDEEG